MAPSFSEPARSGNFTSSREQSPNRGYSIPAKQAQEFHGLETESIASWKQKANLDESKQIRLVRLSHVRYMHTDIESITIFLKGKLSILQLFTGFIGIYTRTKAKVLRI